MHETSGEHSEDAPVDSRSAQLDEAAEGTVVPRYILITQCLQNDFFLNLNCPLSLPDAAVAKLLADPDGSEGFGTDGHRRTLSGTELARSSLARFLNATVGSRLRGHGDGVLHLINIRDWHVPGDSYEAERREYGAHCEAGSWGASFIEGFEGLLAPEARGNGAEGAGRAGRAGPEVDTADVADTVALGDGRLQVHQIRSDTLFDFQGDIGDRKGKRR